MALSFAYSEMKQAEIKILSGCFGKRKPALNRKQKSLADRRQKCKEDLLLEMESGGQPDILAFLASISWNVLAAGQTTNRVTQPTRALNGSLVYDDPEDPPANAVNRSNWMPQPAVPLPERNSQPAPSRFDNRRVGVTAATEQNLLDFPWADKKQKCPTCKKGFIVIKHVVTTLDCQ